MNIFIFIAGVGVVMLVAYDFFYTTLSSSGAGLLTHHMNHRIWYFFLFLSKTFQTKRPLRLAGVFILLSTLALWVLLFWAGLYLMLLSEERSVVSSTKEETAGLLDKIYFSGYVLSTMGNGDFKSGSKFWQVLTAVFSFTGFIFITTAISYFVSVSTAIINKRTLSLCISNLGNSPQQILLNTWNGHDFSRLMPYVAQLQQLLNKHTQSHMAYPVLHFFHTGHKKDAVAVNLTNLDEALSIWWLAVQQEDDIARKDLMPLRDAISFHLNMLKHTFIKPVPQEEPLPALAALTKAGIAIADDPEEIRTKFQQLKSRRSLLSGLLQNDGWSWQDIYNGKSSG